MRFAAVFGLGAVLGACSLLTDTDGLSGGDPVDGGGSVEANAPGALKDAAGTDDGARQPTTDAGTPAISCPTVGRSCVAEAPSGWLGPLLVYDGPEDAAPKCPPTMELARVDAHRGLHAPAPHTCTACACAAGTGATCSLVYSEACDLDAGTQELGSTCKSTSSNMIQTRVDSKGGSCAPNGGKPAGGPATWDSRTYACGTASLPRTGCDGGRVCAPDPPTPFRAKHCIAKEGDVECPGAPYTERLLTQTESDERECTGCSCGPPSNTCQGSYQTFTNGACNGNQTTFPVPSDACVTVPGSTKSLRVLSLTSITPKCEPQGVATPSGSLTAVPASTVCCIP